MGDTLYAVSNLYINDQFVGKGEIVKVNKENKKVIDGLVDQWFIVNENPEKVVVVSGKEQIETLESEKELAQEKVRELELQVSDLQAKLNETLANATTGESSQEVETLRGDIVTKTNEIATLAEAIEGKDKEIADLNYEVEKLNKVIDAKATELNTLQKSFEDSKEKVATLSKENEELRKVNEDLAKKQVK